MRKSGSLRESLAAPRPLSRRPSPPLPSSVAGRRRSRDAGRTLSRVAAVLGAAVLLVGTPQCLWDGLDEYSSHYGETTPVDDGGTTTTTTLPDAEMDADASDDASCPCGEGQECVLGTCETCTPTWTYDHTKLVLGNPLSVAQTYSRPRRSVYVTSARTEGAEKVGYFAELNACRGTLLQELSGVDVGGTPLPPLSLVTAPSADAVGPLAGAVFASLQITGVPPTDLGGFARYDPLQGEVVSVAHDTTVLAGVTSQSPWGIAATGRHVWMSGAVDNGARSLAILSDGPAAPAQIQEDFCVQEIPGSEGFWARPMTTDGHAVYIVASSATALKAWRFDDEACTVAPCNCAPVEALPELPLDVPLPLRALVVGNSLVVAGSYATGGPGFNWKGFLAQHVPGLGWSYADIDDPAPADQAEGFIGLETDGSFVYAGAFHGWAGDASIPTSAELFVYGQPVSNATLVKTTPVSLRSIFDINFDGDGLILSGYDPTTLANARTVRCTMAACP